MQSEPMCCDAVSALLAETVDDLEALPPEAAAHMQECLRCQVELVQYRKILRAMRSLRGEVLMPGEELLDDVLELVRPPATVHKLHGTDRRRAYIGGIAAAATAGAAGAIVIASRVASGRRLAG